MNYVRSPFYFIFLRVYKLADEIELIPCTRMSLMDNTWSDTLTSSRDAITSPKPFVLLVRSNQRTVHARVPDTLWSDVRSRYVLYKVARSLNSWFFLLDNFFFFFRQQTGTLHRWATERMIRDPSERTGIYLYTLCNVLFIRRAASVKLQRCAESNLRSDINAFLEETLYISAWEISDLPWRPRTRSRTADAVISSWI